MRDSLLPKIESDIRGFVRASYPDMIVHAAHWKEDPSRIALFFIDEHFKGLYPRQRYHYLIVVHIGIDRAKQGLVSTKKLRDSASVFVLDQVLHICMITLFAWFFTRPVVKCEIAVQLVTRNGRESS
jgi:Protein of unknown function (DUF3307)